MNYLYIELIKSNVSPLFNFLMSICSFILTIKFFLWSFKKLDLIEIKENENLKGI